MNSLSTLLKEEQGKLARNFTDVAWRTGGSKSKAREMIREHDERVLGKIAEMVEGLQKEIPHGWYAMPARAPSHSHTWNAALDSVITLIQEQKK